MKHFSAENSMQFAGLSPASNCFKSAICAAHTRDMSFLEVKHAIGEYLSIVFNSGNHS